MLIHGVLLPKELAADVARYLERGMRECERVDGHRPHPHVEDALRELQAVARAIRSATSSAGSVGSVTTSGQEMVSSMTTADVADLLGCSTRNVTDLAARGRLPGERTRAGWVFHRLDVNAYLGEVG